MTPVATQHAEEKTSVVHVDIAQQTAELVEQAVLLLRGIDEPFGELASHRKNCIERNVTV